MSNLLIVQFLIKAPYAKVQSLWWPSIWSRIITKFVLCVFHTSWQLLPTIKYTCSYIRLNVSLCFRPNLVCMHTVTMLVHSRSIMYGIFSGRKLGEVGIIPAKGENSARGIPRKLMGKERFQCCHLAYNIISCLFIMITILFYCKYILIKAKKTSLSWLYISMLSLLKLKNVGLSCSNINNLPLIP